MVTFNSLTDSHCANTNAVFPDPRLFQFPNGFSLIKLNKRLRKVYRSFQFPNGFSLVVLKQYMFNENGFQFPNGFSRTTTYTCVSRCYSFSFNSLTDSHILTLSYV